MLREIIAFYSALARIDLTVSKISDFRDRRDQAEDAKKERLRELLKTAFASLGASTATTINIGFRARELVFATLVRDSGDYPAPLQTRSAIELRAGKKVADRERARKQARARAKSV